MDGFWAERSKIANSRMNMFSIMIVAALLLVGAPGGLQTLINVMTL